MPCSPGMTRCRKGCRHWAFVNDYRVAREAAELQRDAATRGHATEIAEHPPIITFKDWLQDHAGDGPD